MVGQYLLNINKSATVSFQKILELNKALLTVAGYSPGLTVKAK
jgi:hypothetical protein